jgi:serine/threonine protein kinase
MEPGTGRASGQDHPLPSSLERLYHEYGLKNELDSAWAVRPLELVRDGGRKMLVLEDPGGEPLARHLGTPMETEQFLRVAIGIAAALGKAHQRGLVHKDIKPGPVANFQSRQNDPIAGPAFMLC